MIDIILNRAIPLARAAGILLRRAMAMPNKPAPNQGNLRQGRGCKTVTLCDVWRC